MIAKRFIDKITNELQVMDVEFENLIKREYVPAIHKQLMSLSVDTSITYKTRCRKKLDEHNIPFFVMPFNFHILSPLFVSGLSDKDYLLSDRFYYLKHNIPMMTKNIFNMNIKYLRTNAKNTLQYSIEALDYNAYIKDISNGVINSIDDYFYRVAHINDNENVFYYDNDIKENTILRLVKSPNVFAKEDDYLEIITDYGVFKLDIYNSEEKLYLAEDGSLYNFILFNPITKEFIFNPNNLVYRNKEKKKLPYLFLKNTSDVVELEYFGWQIPVFHDNDDIEAVTLYENYMTTGVLVEGSKFFKTSNYALYKQEMTEELQFLIRDVNMKKSKGKSFRLSPYRRLGRR